MSDGGGQRKEVLFGQSLSEARQGGPGYLGESLAGR